MTPRSPSPPRLLVVEHDVGVQDLLATFLTTEGYAVRCASSPAEACALLAAQTFQLVLTDLFSTSVRDRFSAVERLRRSAQPIPVGVITAWDVDEEEIIQRGFAFLVRKPFDVEDLSALVAACLESSPSQGSIVPLPAPTRLLNPDVPPPAFG